MDELQLGLGINSSNNVFDPIGMKKKGFDLNCYGSIGETNNMGNSSCLWSTEGNGESISKKKRGFGSDQAYTNNYEQGQGKFVQLPPKTLPLLSWDNHQPNEDDHPTDDQNSSTSNNYEEEDGVVGWPPIKSWRNKLCQQNNLYGRGGGGSNSNFVKVKMEGVVITRKVDLNLYDSYEELKDTLIDMFGRGEENVEAYNLTYLDREGDWLLAGDVPWSSFIESVQRLKLLRSME